MDVEETTVTGQSVNSKENNNNQVGLKNPYINEDEPSNKKRQFELSDKTENGWKMDPGLME